MNQMNLIACSEKLLLALLLLSSLSAQAVDWSFRGPHDAVPENADESEWAEEKIELPAYPEKDKMVEIKFGRPNPRFEFFIDPQTLAVGEDGVVRYVLMLRSLSGSENIMFEGMRCTKRDYKTFAYGTAKAQFRKLRNPNWKEITQTSNNWFRHDLWKYYLCDAEEELRMYTRESILQRIKQPSSVLPRR